MSSCFLTCIKISQEAGQVVWYSHLFKNFPQFVVIPKGFGVVNKAEVDVFLEFPCFLCDSTNVGNLISGSAAFSKHPLYNAFYSYHISSDVPSFIPDYSNMSLLRFSLVYLSKGL